MIIEEVERALVAACRREAADVVEFTVAPRYPSGADPRGGHEWLVEFRVPPRSPAGFARVLDETLTALNTDYRTKRFGDIGLVAPRLTVLPPGTFYRWMRIAGKLGDQHKVPRVTNDRAVADALLATAVAPAPTPAAAPRPAERLAWEPTPLPARIRAQDRGRRSYHHPVTRRPRRPAGRMRLERRTWTPRRP